MKFFEVKSPVVGTTAYRTDSHCGILVGREPTGPNAELRWHLSISHPRRYPDWNEIKAARYEFIPNEVMVAMFLPPMEEYVNLHDYCFHLHQVEAEDYPARGSVRL